MNPIQPLSLSLATAGFSQMLSLFGRFQLHLLILGGAVHSLDRFAFWLLEQCGIVPVLDIHTNTDPGTSHFTVYGYSQRELVWLCIFIGPLKCVLAFVVII